MNGLEIKIMKAYKDAVEFYNMVKEDGDASYADEYIRGMEKMAEVFGYVLYAHTRNDLVGSEYVYVTIAKNENILAKIPV